MDRPRNNMTEPEQERKNREVIEALRRIMDVLSKRLTPEVEPAVVYIVKDAE